MTEEAKEETEEEREIREYREELFKEFNESRFLEPDTYNPWKRGKHNKKKSCPRRNKA